MGQIKVTKAPIEGLYIIEPTVHGDSRGLLLFRRHYIIMCKEMAVF